MARALNPDLRPLSSHAAEAEEVRLYLVTLRGGAPFLSGRDGRILLEWLENGWSVAQISSVMDQVAEDRARKRCRSRMTLSACKTHLEKQAAKKQDQKRLKELARKLGRLAGLQAAATQEVAREKKKLAKAQLVLANNKME